MVQHNLISKFYILVMIQSISASSCYTVCHHISFVVDSLEQQMHIINIKLNQIMSSVMSPPSPLPPNIPPPPWNPPSFPHPPWNPPPSLLITWNIKFSNWWLILIVIGGMCIFYRFSIITNKSHKNIVNYFKETRKTTNKDISLV